MMKKLAYLFSTLVFALSAQTALACEVCKSHQPKVLKNITHGPGPAGNFDYVISTIAVIIVAFALFYSIKYLVKPKENDPDHIKNIIFKQGF